MGNKLTRNGFVVAIRGNRACIQYGLLTTECEWVEKHSSTNIGDFVTLVYENTSSYGLWYIAKEAA